jgi:hypothetical protein
VKFAIGLLPHRFGIVAPDVGEILEVDLAGCVVGVFGSVGGEHGFVGGFVSEFEVNSA